MHICDCIHLYNLIYGEGIKNSWHPGMSFYEGICGRESVAFGMGESKIIGIRNLVHFGRESMPLGILKSLSTFWMQ